MLWRSGLVVLVLVLGQVLAEEAKAVLIDDKLETEERRGGDGRIMAGWDAYPGQHPHHAALRIVDGSGVVATCGGALVARQWVVTAAHCTNRRIAIVVRLGATNLTTPQHMMESHEWYRHPTFREQPSYTQYNDIGLVKLPRPALYSRLVRPILMQSSEDAFKSYINKVMYTSGHGNLWIRGPQPEVLNWVYQRGGQDTQCRIEYPSVIIKNSICTIFYNDSLQAPCVGDGGGPLVHVRADGVPILVGVASFRSTNGCVPGWYTSFTRTGPFHSWFTEVTGIDFENLDDEHDDIIITPPEVEEEDEEVEEEEPTESPEIDGAESDSDEGSGSGSGIKQKNLEIDVQVRVKMNKRYLIKQILGVTKGHTVPIPSRHHGIMIEPVLS